MSMLTILVTERRLDGEFEQTEYGFADLDSLNSWFRPAHNHIEAVTENMTPAAAEPTSPKRRHRDPDMAFRTLRMAAHDVIALLTAGVAAEAEVIDPDAGIDTTAEEIIKIRKRMVAAVVAGVDTCDQLAAELRDPHVGGQR
ncbi:MULTISPECIES: hypothetical protein [unclassified Cryobacterium]|uniref:hypothetical protein n=1 Tax=unclassified Cryobacterium TaxID=2649013 RepID=UPI001069C3B5|nr:MULTISPECIES: hypothetical protein [unclassified Cryobacterium]TFB96270.1 hypothetical protein E3O39_09190 [Cryobacterium sp. MDB2-A-1]TFC12555.1 hypothetical protein E3O35_06355 [Cryobacterium sp. MDB2-A-2]